jgi:hypothetical protein
MRAHRLIAPKPSPTEALHRQIRRSGRTPYQVMGAVLKSHADQVRVLGQRLDLVADWDRNDALKRAARDGGVVREKDFWSPKSSILRAPRSRREAALPLRRADRIAPAEYRLAITAVLRSCVAASSPELTVEVARVLGFDRTGNGLERAISDQIKEMIRDDAILEKEGRLHLQHPDVSHLL